MRIAAHARPGRKALEKADVATAEHEIVTDDGLSQELGGREDVSAPLFLPEPLEPALAHVVLEAAALAVREVA